MDNQFIALCQNGKLNEAKKLYKNNKINIYANDNEAFRLSCYNNHINVAKWLYSLGGINIHVMDEDAFRWSCYNGHINVAQWLYSLGGVNIDATDDDDYDIFRFCCYHGITKIVKWLLLIKKFDDNIVDTHLPEELYEYAFSLGYLPIVTMLPSYTQYKSKIKKQVKNIFEIDDLINIIVAYV